MTALSYLTLPNTYKSIQATPPLLIVALNQTTSCTTQAKPKPVPSLPAVTPPVAAPQYPMDETTSNAATRPPKCKASASSPATSRAATNDSRIWLGNSGGDNRTLPMSREVERPHCEITWMSCTDDACEIHKDENEGACYWPKDPKVRKQGKKTRRKVQDRASISNTALEEGQASVPDIPYLSENLPPFRMNDTILATPPIVSPAFSPLYSQAGYDSDEATNANQFPSTLHSRLMGILT